MTYADLIHDWFDRAINEEEMFTKYIFLYISFTAFLFQGSTEGSSDRSIIQRVKEDEDAKCYYVNLLNQSPELAADFFELIEELSLRPIMNSTSVGRNYWTGNNGVISSVEDWENLVEFWYRVRNNLFHGHKSPILERDQILVGFAYKTLMPFMKNFIEHGLIWDFE